MLAPSLAWPPFSIQFGQEEKMLGHLFERRAYWFNLKATSVFFIPTGRVEKGWWTLCKSSTLPVYVRGSSENNLCCLLIFILCRKNMQTWFSKYITILSKIFSATPLKDIEIFLLKIIPHPTCYHWKLCKFLSYCHCECNSSWTSYSSFFRATSAICLATPEVS